MRLVKLSLVLNVAMAVWCAPAYAQTSSTSNDPSQPTPTQVSKEFDKLMANSEQLHRSTLSTPKTPKSITPVLRAIPEFRKATDALRQAVTDQKGMRGPLQSIEKLIKPFAEYFKELKLKPSPFDPQELKAYSQKDLSWEALTTAERVDNNLQIANLLLRDSSKTGVVNVKAMQFYSEIDSDLKRLKWLADKVESRR